MGLSAVIATSTRLDPTAVKRLSDGGFDLIARTGVDRANVGEILGHTDPAVASADPFSPLEVIVVPATSEPLPGPVVVLSPAESVSSYELYLGAAMAAASGRRVIHLNGRGSRGSAVHSGIAGRMLARSAVTEWREIPEAHPARALRRVEYRPAVIVFPVTAGARSVAQLVAHHPDADVVLVVDRALARFGGAVAEQIGSMVELAFSVGAQPERVVPEETGGEDVPVDREPVPPSDDRARDLPPILASDVVHVRLTDTTLELTNRTAQRLRARVALGAANKPGTALAQFEAALEPGDSRAAPTEAVPGLAGLTPPTSVMRHWSHESEEVYEGGEQRIVAFGIDVLDGSDTVRATRTYRPGNGLDYFITARDLTDLIGRPVRHSALPEPRAQRAQGAPPRDLLGSLAAALAVGASVLATRSA
ncbi:hypothetical protein GCM10022200_17250 [Microbacterium awajiense]|uniref:Uncharacterized protein n=1 Tax=Microbacterium awajiense TaxID=415214 RepID=A0ABP7AKI6_9MICO